jgi:hypothetical protein
MLSLPLPIEKGEDVPKSGLKVLDQNIYGKLFGQNAYYVQSRIDLYKPLIPQKSITPLYIISAIIITTIIVRNL